MNGPERRAQNHSCLIVLGEPVRLYRHSRGWSNETFLIPGGESTNRANKSKTWHENLITRKNGISSSRCKLPTRPKAERGRKPGGKSSFKSAINHCISLLNSKSGSTKSFRPSSVSDHQQ